MARCNSAQCSLSNFKACTIVCYSSHKPGCNNNTCGLFPGNTVTRTSTSGDLGQDIVSFQSTDRSNLGRLVSVLNLLFTCGATSLLKGLASGVKGMVGLSRAKVRLHFQFTSAFSFHRKFAICLRSSLSFSGVVSKSLTFTPLIVNPVSIADAYFDGKPSAEYFNRYVSTNISTVNPYTILKTSLYNAMVNAFVKEVAKIPRVKAVAPFGACFNSKNIGSTRVGPAVPYIDLVLQSKSVY
ncbi:hypothetical protein ACFX1Q_022924 [Malus domestica]